MGSVIMDKHQRFIKLGWELLEHKFRYYILAEPIIQDYDYDILEKEYDSLAEELNLPKSASDMVDFNQDRWACKLVKDKVLRQRRNKKKGIK